MMPGIDSASAEAGVCWKNNFDKRCKFIANDAKSCSEGTNLWRSSSIGPFSSFKVFTKDSKDSGTPTAVSMLLYTPCMFPIIASRSRRAFWCFRIISNFSLTEPPRLIRASTSALRAASDLSVCALNSLALKSFGKRLSTRPFTRWLLLFWYFSHWSMVSCSFPLTEESMNANFGGAPAGPSSVKRMASSAASRVSSSRSFIISSQFSRHTKRLSSILLGISWSIVFRRSEQASPEKPSMAS
mmetsp:Transcript_25347/g.39747  ORF Transcript_25347/g.39747 Transcript_25347/m.39747 type:complete len:242 (+) Transcript_25347:618-1343(+)